jgi:hypothetical protein
MYQQLLIQTLSCFSSRCLVQYSDISNCVWSFQSSACMVKIIRTCTGQLKFGIHRQLYADDCYTDIMTNNKLGLQVGRASGGPDFHLSGTDPLYRAATYWTPQWGFQAKTRCWVTFHPLNRFSLAIHRSIDWAQLAETQDRIIKNFLNSILGELSGNLQKITPWITFQSFDWFLQLIDSSQLQVEQNEIFKIFKISF